jgi:hypothetical protein
MDTYFAKVPNLHTWDDGLTWNSGGFSAESLEQLHRMILERFGTGARIVETGAGNSTITFLLTQPRELISIAPDSALFGRITDYCSDNGIATAPLTSILDFSEVTLPAIAAREIAADTWFDVGLLDGGHGWPTVFVDFCYIHAMVRLEGLLIVDDVQLWSVKQLARFLAADERFELVASLAGGKTLVFRKLHVARFLPDFGGQPYIVQQSRAESEAGVAFQL